MPRRAARRKQNNQQHLPQVAQELGIHALLRRVALSALALEPTVLVVLVRLVTLRALSSVKGHTAAARSAQSRARREATADETGGRPATQRAVRRCAAPRRAAPTPRSGARSDPPETNKKHAINCHAAPQHRPKRGVYSRCRAHEPQQQQHGQLTRAHVTITVQRSPPCPCPARGAAHRAAGAPWPVPRSASGGSARRGRARRHPPLLLARLRGCAAPSSRSPSGFASRTH